MTRLLACALPLALGACVSEQWAKDSGEVADRNVLSDCSQRSMARASYEQMAYPNSVQAPMLQRSRSGNAFGVTSNPVPFPQRDVQEQTFFNLCMKEKGYDLVPGPKY
jgi:hypothetical protein